MSRPFREVAVVYGLVTVACFALVQLARLEPLSEHLQVAVGALFLLSALEMAHRDPGGTKRLGIDLGGLLSQGDPRSKGIGGLFRDLLETALRAVPSALEEAGVALLLAALVFPPFFFGYRFYHSPGGEFALTLPPAFGSLIATQLLAIALPEEAFFRGYVQTRLHDGFAPTRRILGAKLSFRALLLQAALFALIHFVATPHPSRLSVFFPALLFGWLRQVRGGIGAAVVFHASCNVYAELLWRGFW